MAILGLSGSGKSTLIYLILSVD
ncbi:MAG: hypothetical protein QW502_04255 [Candidatus Bathyarchaeia archaeon]